MTIADYFIKKALKDHKAITNMHVLKMIYFAQAFAYVQLQRRLIKDDFYAWRFGPVEVRTYEAFKNYGSNSIMATSGRTEGELRDLESKEPIVRFLDSLYDSLIDMNTFALSNLTHIAGGPWYVTQTYQIIEPEKIRSYYEQELRRQ